MWLLETRIPAKPLPSVEDRITVLHRAERRPIATPGASRPSRLSPSAVSTWLRAGTEPQPHPGRSKKIASRQARFPDWKFVPISISRSWPTGAWSARHCKSPKETDLRISPRRHEADGPGRALAVRRPTRCWWRERADPRQRVLALVPG